MLSIIVYIFLLYVTTASCFTPVGRWLAAGVQYGTKIWFFGGLFGDISGTSTDSREFFALDISNSWETISAPWTNYNSSSSIVTDRATLQIGHDNSSLWLFGQFAPFYQYNASTSKWSVPTLSGASVPTAANSPTSVRDSRGIIYYYGGQVSTNTTTLNNLVWTLNATQFTTLPITNNPVGRMYHTATLVNDTQMYIIGGIDKVGTTIPASIKSIYIYDTVSNHWTVVNTTNPPKDRIYHTAVLSQDGNSIIIFGGENSTATFNDIWVLDVNTFAWKSPNVSGNAPTAVSGSNAFLVGSQMLLMFGLGSNDNFQNSVSVLDTIKWTWMTSFTVPTVNTSLPTNTINSTSASTTLSVYTSNPSDTTSKGGGIGNAATIGAAAGGTVTLVIVVIVIYIVRRKRRGVTPSSRPTSKLIEGEPEYERNRYISELMEGKNAHERNRYVPELIEYERMKPNEHRRIKPDEYKKIKPDEYKKIKPDEYKKIKPDEYKKIKPDEYKQSKPDER